MDSIPTELSEKPLTEAKGLKCPVRKLSGYILTVQMPLLNSCKGFLIMLGKDPHAAYFHFLPWCLRWERIYLQCGKPGFDPWSLWDDPLEKGMAADSSILTWRIAWTEEPGRP